MIHLGTLLTIKGNLRNFPLLVTSIRTFTLWPDLFDKEVTVTHDQSNSFHLSLTTTEN